jgi:hypothetical protein
VIGTGSQRRHAGRPLSVDWRLRPHTTLLTSSRYSEGAPREALRTPGTKGSDPVERDGDEITGSTRSAPKDAGGKESNTREELRSKKR